MLDAVSLFGQKVIAYRPIFRAAGIASTTNGALLASQLLYHYQQAGRQPFHITDLELSAELGLSVKEIRGARADLVTRLGDESFFRYEVRGFKRQAVWEVDAKRMDALAATRQEPSVDAHSPDGANGETAPDPCIDAQSPHGANASARAGECKSPTGRMQVPHGANDLYVRTYKEEIEPPIPPTADPAPQAATPTKRQPSAKARQQSFNPSPDDIPADLLPVQHDLLDFWAEKRGARSQRAWNGLCAELQKIHRDPNGGTDTLRAQLNAAIQAGWQSVTFTNWQRYGAPAHPSLPLGSSPAGRYTSRQERQQQSIEAVTAYLAVADPEYAPRTTNQPLPHA